MHILISTNIPFTQFGEEEEEEDCAANRHPAVVQILSIKTSYITKWKTSIEVREIGVVVGASSVRTSSCSARTSTQQLHTYGCGCLASAEHSTREEDGDLCYASILILE